MKPAKLPLRERLASSDRLARMNTLRPCLVSMNGRSAYALRYLIGNGQPLTATQFSRFVQTLLDRELASWGLPTSRDVQRQEVAS